MKRLLPGIVLLAAGVLLQRQLDLAGRISMAIETRDPAHLWMSMASHVAAAPDAKQGKNNGGRRILYWWDPMLPDFKSDKPGKSPMGMDMVPVYADEGGAGDNGVVRIAPEVVENLGVRTDSVKEGAFDHRINTSGYVNYDDSRVHHVYVHLAGRVEHLAVTAEGTRVKAGDLLFELYSPELIAAQGAYLEALEAGNRASLEPSRQRLIALGLSDADIERLGRDRSIMRTIRVTAPQNGVVTAVKVSEGMDVQPETEALTLKDLGSVWVVADVFEGEYAWLRPGEEAEARFLALPGRVWKGTVDYIYPALDNASHTLRFRVRFDNPGELLLPNLYAELTVHAWTDTPVLYIPRQALIVDGGGARVIMALGDGRFEPRRVTYGIESGDYVEITSGLQAGDRIVTSAQFLIDSEASLRAGLQRLEPAGPATGVPAAGERQPAEPAGSPAAREPAHD